MPRYSLALAFDEEEKNGQNLPYSSFEGCVFRIRSLTIRSKIFVTVNQTKAPFEREICEITIQFHFRMFINERYFYCIK